MGWSQEKLAEKSDLHHNYIGDIERGEENVSVDALMRIATALKIRLSDLVRSIWKAPHISGISHAFRPHKTGRSEWTNNNFSTIFLNRLN